LQTFAGFPLTYGGRVIGVMALFSREIWDQADLNLLRSFAHQATTAIENARLYAHEQQQVLELKNLTQELERSQAQLVQSAKMAAVGRLAAALAHEVNNPLQAIHNCLILSQRVSPKSGEHVNYMRLAEKEVERLIGLVQRMLDFYRPSHSHRTLADVNGLVEQVVEMAQKKLSESQIDLHLDLTPQLPPIHVISDQIGQVILNLMLNAAESLSHGGRLELSSRYVELESADPPTWVEVSVRDDGPGLSPEQVKHLFEPFSSHTAQSNGSGLGLAISFGIVERHGGTIQVDSAPGTGTTFRLRLPVENEHGR
jgi:two-component system NtrC family sensor kinase